MSIRESIHYHKRGMKILHRQVPFLLLSTVLHAAIGSLVPYVGIWMSARIIDELAGSRRPEVLTSFVIWTLALNGVLTLLVWALHHIKMAKRAPLNQHIRRVYAEKMLHMDYAVMEAAETKELFATIVQNDQYTGYGLARICFIVEDGLTACFSVLGGIALTVSLFTKKVPETAGNLTILNHPLFIMMVIIFLCFLSLGASKCIQKANAYWSLADEDMATGNRIYDVFGFWTVKDTRQEEIRIYEQEKMCEYYNERNRNFMPGSAIARYASGKMGLLMSLSAVIRAVFTGCIYVFTCLKALAGAFRVGAVTQYIAAITALGDGFVKILEIPSMLQVNGEYLKKVFVFLDIPNYMKLSGEEPVRDTNDYEIEFRNVSFCYPGCDSEALSGINFKIRKGERIALVGLNGSGKTTFIKLLIRLYDPTSGVIFYNGKDIRELSYSEYMQLFSVVFQDFQLFAFPIGQNVAASERYDEDKALYWLRESGMEERLNQFPKGLDTCLFSSMDEEGIELSGGEKQKTAIARALYKDSPIVIMDEPTAALDAIAEAQIYANFNKMVKDRTAVYISHRLSSCRFCEKIVVFEKGKIIEKGNHEELLKRQGVYATMWQAQAQYYV